MSSVDLSLCHREIRREKRKTNRPAVAPPVPRNFRSCRAPSAVDVAPFVHRILGSHGPVIATECRPIGRRARRARYARIGGLAATKVSGHRAGQRENAVRRRGKKFWATQARLLRTSDSESAAEIHLKTGYVKRATLWPAAWEASKPGRLAIRAASAGVPCFESRSAVAVELVEGPSPRWIPW